MAQPTSRRQFLTTTAAGAVLLGRAPAALGQQVREIQVWHTEVEPQTVKTIQDTSIAEFEKKFPGFKVKQQALGWGDLNTKLDRKSTRLNSSHRTISYAVFCLK